MSIIRFIIVVIGLLWLALMVRVASAEGFHCASYAGTFNCNYTDGAAPSTGARIIDVPQSGSEERAKEWDAYCKPRVEVDDLGVEYLSYAHKGCENGRSKDQ